MGAKYKVILLDNASGSYSINKGFAGINLNNHSINEIICSDGARTALDGSGTINSITFRGNKARFAISVPRIGTLTVADGATWSSILPDADDYLANSNRYGYRVENADKTYKWYDRETVGSEALMNNAKTFDFSDIGVYDLWAEVIKGGYTRKSKIYTLNVAADLNDAVIELDSSEFTYTPNGSIDTEFTPQIKSVKLYDRDVPESVYTISGNTSAADAGSYNLVIEAKTGEGYSGSASACWKILPRLFDEVRACDYIKRYDGTTEVTVEDIGNNHSYPPRFIYSGGPLDSIGLEYGKGYCRKERHCKNFRCSE